MIFSWVNKYKTIFFITNINYVKLKGWEFKSDCMDLIKTLVERLDLGFCWGIWPRYHCGQGKSVRWLGISFIIEREKSLGHHRRNLSNCSVVKEMTQRKNTSVGCRWDHKNWYWLSIGFHVWLYMPRPFPFSLVYEAVYLLKFSIFMIFNLLNSDENSFFCGLWLLLWGVSWPGVLLFWHKKVFNNETYS